MYASFLRRKQLPKKRLILHLLYYNIQPRDPIPRDFFQGRHVWTAWLMTSSKNGLVTVPWPSGLVTMLSKPPSLTTSITDNQIYLDFSAKLLSLQGNSIQILALAKPVKHSLFVRPKDSIFPAHHAQRQAYFVQNTTLKFARKSRQFMKVHVGSDEKFSSGLFARLEFLHSLLVVFDSSL